ncbi:prepilin-type N-terminal cleavage/methylation domain-containing protein [Pengzhenrongella frigida]|uniref:Prepilin-type N-terminal cleavage/methylation domain-containing protein n=1 Tax=Pengzhenrongella frigida TaxID=1259133 RepID=A0A4Q5N5P2_9MICO|nr:prepilin-type N-terminal cleavage/methylation domain-containing protein [Cellulomonas sp. HLT2-17]RYV52873.1 prepilin-type N-terminal cleavage/methylation domain-containing protein [Cellulomonas sp. HLT2-17]
MEPKIVASSRRDDSGFTLVELMVAMMVITAVLLLLMAVQTSALVTTVQARQRTEGSAVANGVMEELRALPYLVLSKGLKSAPVGDPNVNTGNLVLAGGVTEPLVTDSGQAVTYPPLSGAGGTNKTIVPDPASPGRVFTTRTYVSRSTQTASNVLTLTVITTWTRVGNGAAGSVVMRSEAYAPSGGCGDMANQPFLGACQALLASNGGSNGPAVYFTGATPFGSPAVPGIVPVLPGSTVVSASMVVAKSGVGITSQQSSAITSTVTHARSLAEDSTGTLASSGDVPAAVNTSSNDVGSTGAAPANPPDVVVSGSVSPVPVTSIPSGPWALSLAAGSGVSGVAKASTVASCAAGIPAAQPCGAVTTSGGAASSAALIVAGTTNFPIATFATGTSSAFGGRFTTTPGTVSVGCTALTGAGCISAGAQRTLGASTFAAGPWTSPSAPTSLVQLAGGYTDSVRVERGVSQLATTATMTRTGTLTYWNGTALQSVTITPSLSANYTTAGVSWTAGAFTVAAVSTISITPAGALPLSPDAACATSPCSIDANAGSITIATTYTLTEGATVSAFVATTVLGDSHADAAYKAAPVA